ncbi:type II secretion system F family protein [Maioricimonas sp. JC845]|uniref:type II secretion system F family protein n=1 Tax=Maioricimonas sp. JC845 TaxID=3232138 RepID=UPI00345995CC
MPDYQYTAREVSGQQVTGVLSATSQHDALATLASRQLFPIQIDLAESSRAQQKHVGRRVGARQLATFYSQLADLLKSGVPLLRALNLLENQVSSQALKVVLEDVRDQVADGTRLYEAMQHHPKAFNELVISMVRAGEEGGFLEEVLKRIAAFTEHQEDLKGRVVGAMVYPAFLLTFGTLMIAILMIKFVPNFAPLFERMIEQGTLPWATSSLLAISDYVQSYWLIAILIVAGIVFGINHLLQTEQGRWNVDQFRLKAPGMGRIVRSLATARFCRVLGTLLHNGVPILQSLRIAKDATGNAVLKKAISDAADNISTGKSLARPLAASGEFSDEIVEMISVGEEANNLENVLIDIADNLERRTNRELDLSVRMLEPLMLLIMALVVLYVVIALLLPIMQSSGIV